MINTRGISVAASFGLLGLLIHTAMTADSYSENPGSEGDGTYTIGPEYKIDPDLTDSSNPKGNHFQFTLRLADSKIFPGDDKTLEPAKKAVRQERKMTHVHLTVLEQVVHL